MKTLFLFFITLGVSLNGYTADGSSENIALTKTFEHNKVIKGQITDKVTGEGLVGVEIILLDSDKKTYTDFEGNFVIENVENGAQAIIANYISYNKLVKNVYVGNNTEPISILLEQVKK